MQTAYEACFIIDPSLAEEQMTAVIDKYSGVVTRAGGVVDDIDKMELRRLAYPIKNFREGQYILLNFTSEPAAKDELDRIFGISDDVIRAMIIKQDKRADRFPSRARAAEQDRRDREMAARMAAMPQNTTPQPVTDLSETATPGGVEFAVGVTAGVENTAETLPPAGEGTLESVAPESEQEIAEFSPEALPQVTEADHAKAVEASA